MLNNHLHSAVFALGAVLIFISACNGSQVTENGSTQEDIPLKEAKTSVRKMYTPPDCFLTSFDVQLQTPGKTQTAEGTVRSDTVNQRMRLMFRVPYIGISLSQMTVLDETVYIKTIQDQSVKQIPLDRFEVRGLGQNSIRLPFTFFQELLYGRLPENLYENAKWTLNDRQIVTAVLDQGQSKAIYKFRPDYRLDSIRFERPDSSEEIRVQTSGVYRQDASFPKKIEIISAKGNYTEVLRIIFNGVRIDSSCKIQFFPKNF